MQSAANTAWRINWRKKSPIFMNFASLFESVIPSFRLLKSSDVVALNFAWLNPGFRWPTFRLMHYMHFGQLKLIISSICLGDFGVVWGVHPYPSIIYQVEVGTDEITLRAEGADSETCRQLVMRWTECDDTFMHQGVLYGLFHCKTYFHCFFLHRLGSDSHSCGLTLAHGFCISVPGRQADTSMLGARVSMPNHRIFHLHLGDA